MGDVVFLFLTVAFFAIAAAYVRACAAVVGAEPGDGPVPADTAAGRQVLP